MPSDEYDPDFFACLARAQDSHFWFHARAKAIEVVLKDLDIPPGAPPRVLDSGCGTGANLQALSRALPDSVVVGMDLYPQGLEYVSGTVGRLVAGDSHRPPFAPSSFQVVGMFDVLEHLDDDLEVLESTFRLLSAGGYLLATVPAYPRLWSHGDVVAGHRRRYTPRDLETKLTAAGFRVEYLTCFMAALCLPLVLRSHLPAKLRPLSDDEAKNRVKEGLKVLPVINSLVKLALAFERPLIGRRRRIPLGGSLLAVAVRPVDKPTGNPNGA